jgi:hypothetical protein
LGACLPADDQLDRQAARLRSPTGHRITATWTVWALEPDERFADLPVVLRLDHGPQLEVCWEQFDNLSITWNTIDVTVTPRPWVEWPLEWRQAVHPALAAIADATVDKAAATSSRFTTENTPVPLGTKATWLTTGPWPSTSRGDLHISTLWTRTDWRPNALLATPNTAGATSSASGSIP